MPAGSFAKPGVITIPHNGLWHEIYPVFSVYTPAALVQSDGNVFAF
jgi:hypothetical protein